MSVAHNVIFPLLNNQFRIGMTSTRSLLSAFYYDSYLLELLIDSKASTSGKVQLFFEDLIIQHLIFFYFLQFLLQITRNTEVVRRQVIQRSNTTLAERERCGIQDQDTAVNQYFHSTTHTSDLDGLAALNPLKSRVSHLGCFNKRRPRASCTS